MRSEVRGRGSSCSFIARREGTLVAPTVHRCNHRAPKFNGEDRGEGRMRLSSWGTAEHVGVLQHKDQAPTTTAAGIRSCLSARPGRPERDTVTSSRSRRLGAPNRKRFAPLGSQGQDQDNPTGHAQKHHTSQHKIFRKPRVCQVFDEMTEVFLNPEKSPKFTVG